MTNQCHISLTQVINPYPNIHMGNLFHIYTLQPYWPSPNQNKPVPDTFLGNLCSNRYISPKCCLYLENLCYFWGSLTGVWGKGQRSSQRKRGDSSKE
ncbi:hypothetical protein NPIL_534061 [Nephila pilipes]|uniref:Uncharacterized protein n=1 Tax=Nephila pilipes TaxID=299642 RepID=A0A8X6TTI2_NEPPI|nr:hypothetical protein NPIL_534061 [Nephila pilipes]